jgi:hypothetical protein
MTTAASVVQWLACWPLVPEFAGSNSAKAVRFLQAKTSSACLPSQGKQSHLPHVADLGHVKEPCGDMDVGSQAKLKSAISRSISSFANRGLSRLRGVERLWS